MVFTLTFSASAEQMLAGIPRTVEITASQAANIYYTLDGSLPSPLSSVYTGAITMPTDAASVVLSAIAYYIDGLNNLVPSAVLSERFAVDQTGMDDRDRLLFFEGVVYIAPGGEDNAFYYDENGDVVNPIDVSVEEFQLNQLVSETDRNGAQVSFINETIPETVEETSTLYDNNFVEFSSPNGTAKFDPSALYIVIDGRATAPAQQVTLINGPFMSLRDMRKDYGGISFKNTLGTNYVSGSSTRPHYDRSKNIIVFNYFDSNSGRWVKSIQTLQDAPVSAGPSQHMPLVFKWFNFGRQSG